MNDEITRVTPTDGRPHIDVSEAQSDPPRRRPQAIWIVPAVALLAGLWLGVRAIIERGTSIEITFRSAEGLEEGRTRIKYKDVDIGQVTSLRLSEDRTHVVVGADLKKQAAGMLVDDTKFFIVRPRIGARGVSGVGTLLAGAHIGLDIGKAKTERLQFEGLESPPAISSDMAGRRFTMKADNLSSLDVGSPVYSHRVTVGQIVAFRLDPGGKGVELTIFVNAPHDESVRKGTRFWQSSGVEVALDSGGVKINTESLTSMLVGAIAFDTPGRPQSSPLAPEGTVFELHDDRVRAMRQPDSSSEEYLLVFRQSVRGLTEGAVVDFRGLTIGEVTRIGVEMEAPDRPPFMKVALRLYPERLRTLNGEATFSESAPPRALDGLVARGFRAQLRSGNLLTGQLFVALDFFPNAPKAKLDWNQKPLELPTVPGALDELQSSLATFANKLGQLPLDDIAKDLRGTLQRLEQTLVSLDKLTKTLDGELAVEARNVLKDARRLLATEGSMQKDVRETFRELSGAAAAVKTLVDYLERHPDALLRGKRD